MAIFQNIFNNKSSGGGSDEQLDFWPLSAPLLVDHKINNADYLISNNQWNDGVVYVDLFNLLLDEYNNISSQSVTKAIGSYEITYKVTPSGYLITEDAANANNIYSESNTTFWVIDTANSKFKLPLNTSKIILESYKEGNKWYNLYSDGFLEQGGIVNGKTEEVTFLKSYKDINYSVFITTGNISNDLSKNIETKSQDGFLIPVDQYDKETTDVYWTSIGYADIPSSFNYVKYLYYKVGNKIVNEDLIDIAQILNILTNKTDNDGSNANFNNLSQAAKSNILTFAMPIPKLTEGLGQVVQIRQKGGTLVAPSGGTWFYFYMSLNAEHDIYFDETNVDINPNNPSSGICAGGTSLTTGTPLPAFYCGFFIRIA